MSESDSDNQKGDMADKKEKAITPFVEWLASYKKGETDGELTHELRTLIEAVQDTGKAGTITLTLRVNRKSDNQVTIIEDIKVTVPQHSRSEAIYFLDQHLNLTRSDPRQGVLTPIHGRASGGEGE